MAYMQKILINTNWFPLIAPLPYYSWTHVEDNSLKSEKKKKQKKTEEVTEQEHLYSFNCWIRKTHSENYFL